MKTLLALSKNTFRETIRDKVLWVIIFFGIALILVAQLLSAISAREGEKVILDLGLAMIDIFGIIITIFVGTHLIFREIDKKTILLILSKPISRRSFLLSKFLGLASFLFLASLIMFLVFILVLVLSTNLIVSDSIIQFSILGEILLIVFFSFLSFIMLLSVVIFFSSFVSPAVAAFASLGFFVIGHLTDDFRILANNLETTSVFVKKLADFVYYFMPNFSILNLKNFVLHDIPFDFSQLILIAAMCFFWVYVFVFLGTKFFSKKEF